MPAPARLPRRTVLAGLAAPFAPPAAGAQVREPLTLTVASRTLEVNRRAARVFAILRPDGGHGVELDAGTRFRARLLNRTGEATVVHWHGQTPPHDQDGVAGLSQPAIAPGAGHDYDFALDRPGSHWMHSHLGLQLQRLLAAQMVVRDPAEAARDEQAVTVMLHDFSFRDPEEILARLRGPAAGGHAGHGMPARAMPHAGHAMPMAPGHGLHANDVEYDAYLANDRTLDDPFVARVERGARVRLRIVNAAAATNFHIDTGALPATLAALDGNPVAPLAGTRFPVAMGQRLDLRLALPAEEGAWPVLALREGAAERTGLVLATARATVPRLPASGPAAPLLDLALERRLAAAVPLPPRPAARTLTVDLTGEHDRYDWGINGAAHGAHAPLDVRAGERVHLAFVNHGTMAHPMHLHGHHFQVLAIGAAPFAGARRDTVLVPPHATVTVGFDADNPGLWPLHCHHIYHMAAGMMTELRYVA